MRITEILMDARRGEERRERKKKECPTYIYMYFRRKRKK